MEGDKKIVSQMKCLVLPFLILLTIGCSTTQKQPASEPVAMETEELRNGRIVFNQYCNSCHPEGSSGLGPSIINKPLPKFLMRFQIRHGIGVMPAFKDDVLEDQEVKNIARYLVHLRKERDQ